MGEYDLNINITGNDSNFESALSRSRANVRKMAQQVEESGMSIENMFNRIQKAAALSLAGFSAKEFIQKVVSVRGEFQQLEVAFNTMLGNTEKANNLLKELTQTAAKTPFDLQGVTQGAKQLLAYGIEAEKVNDTLIHLGDIAAGLSIPLTDLVYLYGTTMVQGRMFTQDLRQFQNRGIPIAEELAKIFGVTKDRVGELVTAGKVGAKEFNQAIMSMSSEGGKFAGLMENQSKTITGQIANIGDALDVMFNNMGQESEGLINGTLSTITLLVENYDKVGKTILTVVEIYGVYKAATMTAIALQTLQATGVGALTAAETIHYGWLVLCEKAQALLNKTMLANPYVLVATLIAGVTAALWNLKSQADEAAEAQENLNKSFNDTQANIASEQKNIDQLFDKLRKAKKGTEEYKNAKDAILNQYGQYLKGLGDEANALADVEAAYKAVSKAAREAALARGREAAMRDVQDTYGKNYSDNMTGLQNMLTNRLGSGKANELLGRVQKELGDFGNITKQLEKRIKDSLRGTSDYGNASALIQGLRNNEKYISDYTKLVDERFKIDEKVAKNDEVKTERNKAAIEKEKKDLQDKLNNLSKEKALGEEGLKLKQEIQKRDKELEAYDASGKKSNKAANDKVKANAKAIEEELRFRDKYADVVREAEDAQIDAKIAAIQNDAEREREERRVEHEHTLRDIKLQENDIYQSIYEQRKKAYENSHSGKSYENTAAGAAGWQGVKGTLTDEEKRYYNERSKVIKAELDKENAQYSRYVRQRYMDEAQAMNDFLKEYGSIEQQRYAITREYDQKIADTTDTVQKAALQKQKENALKELDFKELQQSINWEVVFNDLDKLSKSALEDLRKKLKDALDMKDITPENAKVLSEKLLEIDNRLSDNMWTSMIPALKERQRLVNEVKNAEEDIAREQQKVAKATIAQGQSQSSLQSLAKTLLGRNLTKEELASESGAELAKKLNLSGDAAQKLAESFDKAKTSATDLSKAHEQLTLTQKQADNVNNLLRSLTGKGANDQNFGSALTSIFKNAAEAGGGGFIGYASLVQSNINSMAEFTDKIGLAGTDFGDAVHGFADGVNGFMGAIQSLASGDIFGAVNGVIDGFAGLGRAIDSIGGGFLFGDDDRYQEALDKWGWVLDSWKDNIAYERELMEKAYGVKAIEASRDAVKAAQDAAKAAREIYNGWAGSGAGLFSHSNAHNVNSDVRWDLLRQYNPAWYRQMNGDVSNLFNLTWQELEKLKNEAPQFWASIHSVAQDYLDQYIEAGKAAEETLTALNEQLTTTTKENVFDDFLTSLYDLADGAEDVTKSIADNWQKMVNRMVINNLIAKDFQDQLEKWYQRLAKLQSDRAEGRISDTTYGNRLNDLLNEYNKLFGEAEGKVEEFTKLGIIKPIEDATEKTSDFFSGLRDSFKSFFEDTEADAEEWSKNIAQQIAGDLLEQLVMTDEFDAWMEDWKKRYAEVLNVQAPDERSQRMKMLIEELNAMRDKAGEKAKEIRESLGLIAEGEAGEESVFSNLRDTFLDTMTDIEQDAEAFRKRLEETMIKDVLEKQVLNVPITINGMTFDNFDAYVTRWNERYTDAVESGNQAAIDALLEELMQAREITLEAAKELRERLKDVAEDTTFSDMSDNFVSTLMDMSNTADDWAQDLGRSIAKRIIEQMVVTTMVQPLLDNLQKAVDKALGMEGATYESAMNDAGVKGALKDITDAFPGLQTLVRGIMESFGVTFDEIKEGFSDLRGSFVSALTDMEGDAETFGRNIGKAMREQMLDAYIDKQYQEQLAAINEEWAEALESGDPERIAAIEQKVAELYATIGNDEAVKSLIDDIRELGKEAEEADTTFSDMADSWTSALMDMDSDAKDWGKQIGRTLAEKIIKEMIVGKQLQPYLDAIQDAFNKAVSEEGATAESVMAAVTPEIDAATAAMERMNPVIKGIMEQLNLLDEKTSVTPFDNLRSSYLSALMDMSKETKDWTKEISQMIAESFVDSFVLGSAFDEKLEEWKKRYKEITEDGSLSEEQRMKQLKTLSELIAADTEDSKKQVSEILKWLGIREGQDQSVTMNMAEAATYDQFELYLGMATSHLMVAEQTKSVTQQILSTLQSMSGITSPSENYGQQIFMRLGTTNEYLLAVKRATEAIRSEFATKLDIMNSHLSKL